MGSKLRALQLLLIVFTLAPAALASAVIGREEKYVNFQNLENAPDIISLFSDFVFVDYSPGKAPSSSCSLRGYYDATVLNTSVQIRACFEDLESHMVGSELATDTHYYGSVIGGDCLIICLEDPSESSSRNGLTSADIDSETDYVDFEEVQLEPALLASFEEFVFTDDTPGRSLTGNCTIQGYYDSAVLKNATGVSSCFEQILAEGRASKEEIYTERYYPFLERGRYCLVMCKEDDSSTPSSAYDLHGNFLLNTLLVCMFALMTNTS